MWSIERDVYFWLMDRYEEFLKEARVKGIDSASDWETILNRKRAQLLAIEKKIFDSIFSGQQVMFAEVVVSEEEISSFFEGAKSDSYFQEDSSYYRMYRYHVECQAAPSQSIRN